MALIAMASAKGSPGVTTAALALGALWPRPVLVAECDTAGADVPLRMADESGGVLDSDRGLLSLAAAGRKGLNSDLVLRHTQRAQGGLEVLAGTRVPEQAAGLTGLWPTLGTALDGVVGYDVLADCGRIGASPPQSTVIRASRLLVMVCTADPGSVVHLRERLHALAPVLEPSLPTGTPIAVAVVAPQKAKEAVHEVRETLERTEVPLRAVWHVARDPKGAGFFNGAVIGRADRTLLVKSLLPVCEESASLVAPFFQAPAEEASAPAEEPRSEEQPTPEEQPTQEMEQ